MLVACSVETFVSKFFRFLLKKPRGEEKVFLKIVLSIG